MWTSIVLGGCDDTRSSDAAQPATKQPGRTERLTTESIVGEWSLECRVKTQDELRCSGRTTTRDTLQLRDDGVVVSTFADFDALEGTWSLEGERLTLSFDVAGQHVDEGYDARLSDGRLRLWADDSGRIFARPGAKLPRASAQTSELRGATASSVAGVDYELVLPPNYHLVPNGRGGQRWDPSAGEGLYFEVRTSERSGPDDTQPPPVGKPLQGSPCPPETRPLHVGSTVHSSDGEDTLVRLGTRVCVPQEPLYLRCTASHHRGHLLAHERESAAGVCQSLRLAEAGLR